MIQLLPETLTDLYQNSVCFCIGFNKLRIWFLTQISVSGKNRPVMLRCGHTQSKYAGSPKRVSGFYGEATLKKATSSRQQSKTDLYSKAPEAFYYSSGSNKEEVLNKNMCIELLAWVAVWLRNHLIIVFLCDGGAPSC